jgi:hypothetical protein
VAALQQDPKKGAMRPGHGAFFHVRARAGAGHAGNFMVIYEKPNVSPFRFYEFLLI